MCPLWYHGRHINGSKKITQKIQRKRKKKDNFCKIWKKKSMKKKPKTDKVRSKLFQSWEENRRKKKPKTENVESKLSRRARRRPINKARVLL